MTPAEAIAARNAHAARSYELVEHIAARSGRYERARVLAYQQAYNASLSDLQQAVTVFMRGDVSLANRMRELAPDGVWGSRTAEAASFFIACTDGVVCIPGRVQDVPGWFRLYGPQVRARLASFDRQATAAAAPTAGGSTGAGATAALETGATTAVAGGSGAAAVFRDIMSQTGSSAYAAVDQVDPGEVASGAGAEAGEDIGSAFGDAGGAVIRGRAPGSADSMLPWVVGGLTVLTVGGILVYAAMKKRRKKKR